MIIVSRIIHVKVDRRLNVTTKFIYQRRLSSRLAIVMFRGTPCIKQLNNFIVIVNKSESRRFSKYQFWKSNIYGKPHFGNPRLAVEL